ncbi:larval serum protein 1 beta chain-like [Ceratitis capitata]|uniref:larval serum protein 1 beta chain-like n=1 Tax=Ceratitis capitata TaxID=7213 RepID=UPI0003299E43|nr:larval serum protein 1 beta chain-like [Ceratitis capitata]
MNFIIFLPVIVGLSFVKSAVDDLALLEKQKFLFEIVHRIEDPPMFEEHIRLGRTLVYNKEKYQQFDANMKAFYESHKQGALLPRGEFFGALVKSHHEQAHGLFNYFYFAKDLATCQQNIAWARIHVNEGMFVYALTLTVIHRDDFKGLMLPTIYEILPKSFFNSKLIHAAEKFDYITWSKYSQYERELDGFEQKSNKYLHDDYFYMKDFKTYQWWKLMDLAEHWHAAEWRFPLRENSKDLIADIEYASVMKNVQMFWHPVDYTRDIKDLNEHSALSYFTEDLGWNEHWYNLNMDYAFFLEGKTFSLDKDRRGEWWLFNVDQILTRYYMEVSSHELGKIPKLSWCQPYEYGYNPHLISHNGVGYGSRINHFDHQKNGNCEGLDYMKDGFKRIFDAIESGFLTNNKGEKVDLHTPESVEYIGSLLQGNVDVVDKNYFRYWSMLNNMYLGNVALDDFIVEPSVNLNFETMMRDPIVYSYYKKNVDAFHLYKYKLEPYTTEELLMKDVKIENVEVSELVTYFDWVDFDVSNLLNEEMVFNDGKLVWDKSLYARQMRLNHKPFDYEAIVRSEKPQKVVLRAFFGPKFDANGRIISLKENHFIEFDKLVHELAAGENRIKRSSDDFYWTVKDRPTYTELYHQLRAAMDGKHELPLNISEPSCGFPDRLLLPKGWESGYPMQFFFHIAPYEGSGEGYDSTTYCRIGTGERHIDNRPFGYPLDRPINENQFLTPNMYFKDISIYHYNTLKPHSGIFKNFSEFDYTLPNVSFSKCFL